MTTYPATYPGANTYPGSSTFPSPGSTSGGGTVTSYMRPNGQVVKIGSRSSNVRLLSYSIVEDSTPVDPSDSSGGIQQATFTVRLRPDDDWKSWRGQSAVITDRSQGTTSLIVTDLTVSQSIATVTANSSLAKAAVVRTTQPYQGTLGGAIRYYLGLVSITTNIVVDVTLESVPVVFQGWEGEVYFHVSKMLGPAFGFELALVGEQIVCRPFRTREATHNHDVQLSHSISQGNVAQSVVTNYYESTYKTNALAYPPGGWTPDVTVYQVDAGQVITVDDIPLNASLTSIQQPVCVTNVLPLYAGSSVYAVAGNDGLPIPPAEWAAFGGALSVKINDDTRSLSLTITGMNYAPNAPFRIAVSSGPSNYYSALRIVGTGVFTNQKSVTGYSTLSTDLATQVLGTTVDSPFITNQAQAYDRNIWTLAHYSGLTQALSVASTGINRAGDSGSYSFATVADFNQANSGKTIADFDSQWVGQSIDEFNQYWKDHSGSSFQNQAFGNLGGARILSDDSYFRIRTATDAAGQVSYTAEADTTVADFDALWVNKKISDFDSFWSGKLVSDFDVSPLSFPAVSVPALTSG